MKGITIGAQHCILSKRKSAARTPLARQTRTQGGEEGVFRTHRVVVLQEGGAAGGPPAHEPRRLALRVLQPPVLVALQSRPMNVDRHYTCDRPECPSYIDRHSSPIDIC